MPRRRYIAACMVASATLALAAGAGATQADEEAANILEPRTEVAEMAEQTVNSLESRITVEDVAGWAVFSGKAPSAGLEAGVGMAEHLTGEVYFLQIDGAACIDPEYRQVLVFRDEDLFRQFRQGELQGDQLAQLQFDGTGGPLTAFRVRPGPSPEMEPTRLEPCRFSIHEELQRALVAKPSETEEWVDEDHVDVDDN